MSEETRSFLVQQATVSEDDMTAVATVLRSANGIRQQSGSAAQSRFYTRSFSGEAGTLDSFTRHLGAVFGEELRGLDGHFDSIFRELERLAFPSAMREEGLPGEEENADYNYGGRQEVRRVSFTFLIPASTERSTFHRLFSVNRLSSSALYNQMVRHWLYCIVCSKRLSSACPNCLNQIPAPRFYCCQCNNCAIFNTPGNEYRRLCIGQLRLSVLTDQAIGGKANDGLKATQTMAVQPMTVTAEICCTLSFILTLLFSYSHVAHTVMVSCFCCCKLVDLGFQGQPNTSTSASGVDYGSPQANAAVQRLEKLGAVVYPPGSKDAVDWGVLAGALVPRPEGLCCRQRMASFLLFKLRVALCHGLHARQLVHDCLYLAFHSSQKRAKLRPPKFEPLKTGLLLS